MATPTRAPRLAHEEAQPAPAVSRAYANYVLAVMFIAYVFNFIDRQIISILLEPIKQDLGVSDTAMGFLSGTAFALFYATLGVPIARWADVWVRRSIIAIGTALWSAMTVASGFAQNFLQMSLARIGVGVGEAALSPPAHSLLADYFPVERRATALGVYAMGIHIGILFGVLAGGWLDEYWGWRMAFVVVGAPGLLIAALVRWTVREPPRGGLDRRAGAPAEDVPSVSEVARFLWSLRSFRHLSFATALVAFAGYSFANWAPTFLRRVHDMSGGELGTKYGIVLGVGGAIGSVLAGVLADRLGRSDLRWWLWVPAVAAIGPLPFVLAFYFHPDVDLALAILFPGLIIAAMYQGPVFSTVQTLVKLRMRALTAGILLFVINIIGLGLGPPSVGLLNDHVFHAYGDEAIRYSLTLIFVVMGTWSALHYVLGARWLRADLRATGGAGGG
jgi:predicted MFS family arabinose efflux permease